jgi:hypothetical protein
MLPFLNLAAQLEAALSQTLAFDGGKVDYDLDQNHTDVGSG